MRAVVKFDPPTKQLVEYASNVPGGTMYSEREKKWVAHATYVAPMLSNFQTGLNHLSLPGNNWVCKECIGVHRLRMVGLSERALRREQLLPTGLKF